MPRAAALANPGPASAKALKQGHEAFIKRETRDAMYKVATFLIKRFWGKPERMAEGLGVLLAVWNNAFYRYGLFDYDELENCIGKHQKSLTRFRKRNILSYEPAKDNQSIRRVFDDFLDALSVAAGDSVRRSPVAVAKALHLLAPNFFPLWDYEIAKAYGCNYAKEPADKYLCFMAMTKEIAENLADEAPVGPETLLKLIDEYNYSRHTQGWI